MNMNLEPIGWGLAALAVAAVLIVALLTNQLSDPKCVDGLTPVSQDGSSLICKRINPPPPPRKVSPKGAKS